LQGLDYLSSQIAWQKETGDGNTNPTTTAHIVDYSTIKSTSLASSTLGKDVLSISNNINNNNNNGNNSHSTINTAMNERIPTTSSDNKGVANANATTDWWEPYTDAISQPFHPWNGTKWCYNEEKTKGRGQKNNYGFMLSKVYKAASSTAAGVTLIIAHRVATRRGHANVSCLSYYDHEFSVYNDHSSQDPSTSFLWATVQEPYSRARSKFFFSQTKKNISQLDFLKHTLGDQLRQVRKRETSKANKLLNWGGTLKGGDAGLKNLIVSNDPHKLGFEYIKEHTYSSGTTL
jgi:hypothetical protein